MAVVRHVDMANALSRKIVVWVFLNREKEKKREFSGVRHVGSRNKLPFAIFYASFLLHNASDLGSISLSSKTSFSLT